MLCTKCSIARRNAKKLFARYERNINKAMDVYLRFVDAWYSKEFIEVFLHPQDIFQIPPAVNAVLGGNAGDRLRHPMADVDFLYCSSGCSDTFRSARAGRWCRKRKRRPAAAGGGAEAVS